MLLIIIVAHVLAILLNTLLFLLAGVAITHVVHAGILPDSTTAGEIENLLGI